MALEALWKELFEFPAEAFVQSTTKSIMAKIHSRGYSGAVFGASGGIDSLVSASLCIRAKEENHKWRVVGLQMIDSRVKGEIYNSEIYRSLGAELVLQNITSEAIRHEKRSGMPPRWLTLYLMKMILRYMPEQTKRRLILAVKEGKAPRQVLRHFYLLINLHRLRIARLREFAAHHRLMPIICANRTEALLGYFVEDGIDDPVMGEYAPISGLYKSQVFTAAKYLGIPKKVIEQKPSPGFGGIHDEDIIGPYEMVDPVLFGICAGFSNSEITSDLWRHVFPQNEILRQKNRRYNIQYIRFLRNLYRLSRQK